MAAEPSVEAPLYTKVLDPDSGNTQLWIISCDEGWRESIVCEGMYEWAADWMLSILQRQPFAPRHRP